MVSNQTEGKPDYSLVIRVEQSWSIITLFIPKIFSKNKMYIKIHYGTT